jgi:hypothetical protein
MKSLRNQFLYNGKFTHKGLTYTKGINDSTANKLLNEIEPFNVGERVYVFDPHKTWVDNRDRARGGDYQGGRAFGTVHRILPDYKAEILYDDVAEPIVEDFSDLRREEAAQTDSEFTPGPWFINGPYNDQESDLFIRTTIDGENYDIANLACDETGQAIANARLIASAPELLDTCQSVLQTLEQMVSDSTVEGMKFILQSAIQKAQGAN